jgi:CBS domain-containing protein
MVPRELVVCAPDDSVEKVANLMKDGNVGAVLVEANGRPVGIVTDRDLVVRCLALGADPTRMTAEVAMSAPVETVPETAGIYEVAAIMSRTCARRVPIVDRKGRAVGLLSFDDLFELLAAEIDALNRAVRPAVPKLSPSAA